MLLSILNEILLCNQNCEIQSTLTNFHSNEYSQGFNYCHFSVKLDSSAASCNTLNDLSNKVCIPNKTEDLNINACNMING